LEKNIGQICELQTKELFTTIKILGERVRRRTINNSHREWLASKARRTSRQSIFNDPNRGKFSLEAVKIAKQRERRSGSDTLTKGVEEVKKQLS
jgi:hypothetical protein